MSIRKSVLAAVFVPALLTGCAGGPDVKPRPLQIVVDFNSPSTDWIGGYSDYSSETQPTDIIIEPRPLPEPFDGYGLYTAGTNRSDDLFIYIKKKFSGFVPDQEYLLTFKATFLTDAPAGCVGVGGPPGESVTVKAGAAPIEPSTIWIDGQYRMNIDKGNQADGGKDALALGNIAGRNTDCDQPRFESKTVGSSAAVLRVTSNPTGHIWIMFGIDSGFEAKSEIYYQSALIKVSPYVPIPMN